jgi:hypothetical protein
MLDPICHHHSKCQSFRLVDRLLLSTPIGHDSWKAGNLRKPAPIVLSLEFLPTASRSSMGWANFSNDGRNEMQSTSPV